MTAAATGAQSVTDGIEQRIDLGDRFWSRVNFLGSCWEWAGSVNAKGYGQFSVEKATPKLSHRLSYEYAFGPFRKTLCVCHKCDNPPCVRPDHLFLGDRSANNMDMLAKGRARGGSLPGEKSPTSILTDRQVSEMRALFSFRGGAKEAAREYGISATQAWRIISHKSWSHIK